MADSLSGYTTQEALQHLYQELQQEINCYEVHKSQLSWKEKFLNSAFYHRNKQSVFHWPECFIIAILAIILLIGFYFIDDHARYAWFVVEALILLLLGAGNVYMIGWDDQCKQTELINKTKDVLRDLEEYMKLNSWYPSNYLNLNCPLSPCVSVQWTYRDNELVNLPTNFLVKGDLVLLRPGQEIQVKCREVELSLNAPGHVYEPGDVYLPSSDGDPPTNAPKGRKPIDPVPHVVLETPFVKKLRLILRNGVKRTPSLLQNHQFLIGSIIIVRILIPAFFIIMCAVNMTRYILMKDGVGHWAEMILALQVHAVVPLVPLMFPLLWNLLNFYGLARILTVYQKSLETTKHPESSDDLCSDDSSISIDEATEEFTWRELLSNLKNIVVGRTDILPRTVSMVHALGTVTAFCCVDKKGVLSWPMPVAEKVFFLTPKKYTDLIEEERSNTDINVEDGPALHRPGKHVDIKRVDSAIDQGFYQESKVEVLEVSHDLKNPYGLFFDDPDWKQHIDSLKPLGLNILLNTCNTELADEYTKFSDHVTCTSLKKEDTIAVVNRRCLCELSKQIGFSDEAMKIFDLQMQLGMFKYASSDVGAHDRLYRTRSFIRHKTPMPNMVSVAVRDVNSGMCQLMTQGTADILLDLCSDYWNGLDLCALADSDRRRVLDFYHRQSMSAYCTAFSYCPLTDKISNKFKDIYLELPEEGLEISSIYRSPTPTHSWDVESLDSRVRKDILSGVIPRVHSMDSLLSQSSQVSISDIDGCFRAQCNQIFIGMITMQYHAKGDIVQLIENLDNACIRFVHFSKENELRSRVFSEKMGLESGWNCHISLLSEKASEFGSSMKNSTTSEQSHDTENNDQNQETATLLIQPSAETNAVDSVSYCAHVSVAKIKIKIDDQSIKSSNSPSPEKTKSDFPGSDTDVVIADGRKVSSNFQGADILSADKLLTSAAEDEVRSQAPSSHFSENTDNTDDSMGYDILNRAKLPKGIENIRPHLQNVDNVPLLVSLFTDCTSDTTLEMIKIMQEYGEVVLVLGSSANIKNTELFLQADVSIAVEPLYPGICVKQRPVFDLWVDDNASPLEMANRLQSIPCSLAHKRDDNISFVKLIAEARFHVQSMKNVFQLLFCYSLSLTLIQLANAIFLLPPLFTGHHILWLLCIILPCLSVTPIGNEIDPAVMSQAASKNVSPLSKTIVLEFVMYTAIRFVPSLGICLLTYGLNLYYICQQNPARECTQLLTVMNATTPASWNNWGTAYGGGYSFSQNLAVLQLVLYFVCISVSLVERNNRTWQRPPINNRLWCIIVIFILLLQLFYMCTHVSVAEDDTIVGLVHDVHASVWCLLFLWPLCLLPLNECIKLMEIKLSERYHKRAQLEFGTKLGMNSPF